MVSHFIRFEKKKCWIWRFALAPTRRRRSESDAAPPYPVLWFTRGTLGGGGMGRASRP